MVPVGIAAGASTPTYIIKEVHRIIGEILNNEGFDFMAEVDKTFKKGLYIENRVKAFSSCKQEQSCCRLRHKALGLHSCELSQDPNAAPSDVVKVGDEIEAIVAAVNDAEGTVTFKKKVDSVLGGSQPLWKLNETLEG